MKTKEEYIKELNGVLNEASKALNNGNMTTFGAMIEKMSLLKESCEEDERYAKEIDSSDFPRLNSIIENALPTLFAKNKKALSECMKTIMGDKNLKTQFKFINALRSYNSDKDATGYINESLDLIRKDLDMKTLKSSNKKLAEVIKKYSMDDETGLSESENRFNENCSYIIETEKKVGNLMEYTNRMNEMSDYMISNVKEKKDKIDVFKMAESVEKKLSKLNESEREFFNDILGIKNKVNDERRKNLFDKIKKGCLESIDKLLPESNDEEKERLLSLKETLLAKDYDKDTVVEDVAKLLEIGSILSEK